MKIIEGGEAISSIPGRRIEPGEVFRFRCHSGLSCFNRCCRNLNLFLDPYDVVRLKTCLALDSDQFLDRYVDVVLRPGLHFPEVLLRMADNADATCPFLTDAGCTVYPDRPGTCRAFPMEHGAYFDAATDTLTPLHFLRPPEFCEGESAPDELTVADWIADQGAEPYQEMTHTWGRLKARFRDNPWGAEGPDGRGAKMAFMAAYNVDRFREFVFGSSFLKRHKVKPDLKKRLRIDDVALLRFGMEWIGYFAFGIRPTRFRPRG